MIASNGRILSQFEHIVTGLSVRESLPAVRPSGCGVPLQRVEADLAKGKSSIDAFFMDEVSLTEHDVDRQI
jgi:hypothetical protein